MERGKERGKDWCGILSVTNAAGRDQNRQGKHNSRVRQLNIKQYIPPKPLDALYV